MPVIWLDRENGTNNYWAIFHNEEETYTKNFKIENRPELLHFMT